MHSPEIYSLASTAFAFFAIAAGIASRRIKRRRIVQEQIAYIDSLLQSRRLVRSVQRSVAC